MIETETNSRPASKSTPFFAVPEEIKNPNTAAKTLAALTGISKEETAAEVRLRQILRLDQAQTDRNRSRRNPESQASRHLFSKGGRRYYPKRDLAAHVLGYVNIDGPGHGGPRVQV